MKNQTSPNAGNVIVRKSPEENELHGMIETAERMISFIDDKLPELESADNATKQEMAELRGIVTNIDNKLRTIDDRTDRDDKVWRGDSPLETNVYRSVGKVIQDSFKNFRTNGRYLPDEYKVGKRANADNYESSDSLGGITVPTLTYDNVAYFMREKSLARLLCMVIPMTTDKIDVPALTTGTPSVYYVKDGNAPSSNSAVTFVSDKQLQAKTLMSVNIVEGELIEDTVLAYSTFWAQVFLDQFALKENSAVFSETATDSNSAFTGAMQAVLTANTNVQATAANHFSSVTYDDFVAVQNMVNASAREGSVFVMNKAAFRYVQALRDSTGYPILHSSWSMLPGAMPVPSPQTPRPTVLLGDPCYITEALPSPTAGTTANKGIVLYGNFGKGHYFGDRKQMAIQWSSEAAFTSGALVMRCRERFAALNVLTDGFAVIKSKA